MSAHVTKIVRVAQDSVPGGTGNPPSPAEQVPTPREISPARTPRPAWLDERLFPYTSHFVAVDGNLVHYVDEGSGPVILFVHSNAVWSFDYRHLIAGLRDRFRCIALDLPGFGLSQAAEGYAQTLRHHSSVVERFMEALNLTDVTLLAHDTGGPIGLGVVSRHPEWFRGVALLDTFGFPLNDIPKLAVMLKLVGSSRLSPIPVDDLNLVVRSIGVYGVKRRRLSRPEKAALAGPFTHRASRHVIRELFASVLDDPGYLSEIQEGLRRLAIPALLMPAEKSGAVSSLLPGLERTFRNHRSVILTGAGHFSADDVPEQIVPAVRAWWDEEVSGRLRVESSR